MRLLVVQGRTKRAQAPSLQRKIDIGKTLLRRCQSRKWANATRLKFKFASALEENSCKNPDEIAIGNGKSASVIGARNIAIKVKGRAGDGDARGGRGLMRSRRGRMSTTELACGCGDWEWAPPKREQLPQKKLWVASSSQGEHRALNPESHTAPPWCCAASSACCCFTFATRTSSQVIYSHQLTTAIAEWDLNQVLPTLILQLTNSHFPMNHKIIPYKIDRAL